MSLLAIAGSPLLNATGSGSPQPPDPPQSSDRPRLPHGQIPDLGRPTEAGDEVPTFDYDAYFPGVWTFEWRVPDSPLGPGGVITGTETFEPGGDGRHYRARVEAAGPGGPFTTKSAVIYLAEQGAFVRHDTDSRGFAMLRAGRIGGDLGGFYTIHYETAPFEAAGQEVRLRLTTRLVSPVNYRVESRISVDGGPFTNFGNAWWRKVAAIGETGTHPRGHPVAGRTGGRAAADSAGSTVAVGVAQSMPIRMTVACVEAGDQGAFYLTNATDPEPIADRLPPQPEPSAALGSHRIRLIGTLDEFRVARHVGHLVWAKGLLIDDETERRLNLVSITHLSPDCR